jgi:hypothetical protein
MEEQLWALFTQGIEGYLKKLSDYPEINHPHDEVESGYK